MIAYIIGFLLVGCISSLPSPSVYLLFAFLIIVLHLAQVSLRRHLILFLMGSLFAISFGYLQLSHRLDINQRFKSVEVAGTVIDLPTKDASRWQFKLRLMHPLETPLHNTRVLKLSWYEPGESLRPGDQLTLIVNLKPVHGQANPHAFDYERWALNQGIDASGYVSKVLKRSAGSTFSHQQVRSAFKDWLVERFAATPIVASTLVALLLGDKSELESTHWELLRDTGTTHLLVVSGLHIGICVLIGWWFGRFLGVVILRGNDHALRYLLPIILSLLCSGLYVALSGFSIPTQRAWIMAACLLSSQIGGYRLNTAQRWWLAMAVVFTLQPLALYDPGFWLSFIAVGALLLLVSARKKGVTVWGFFLSSQMVILLLLGPFLLLFFGSLPLVSPFINLLAIPFVSLLLSVIPLAMLLEWVGFYHPLDGVAYLIETFWQFLAWVSEHASAWQLHNAQVTLPLLFLALLGSVLILQPARHSLRVVGVICWLSLFYQADRKSLALSIWVFDVGQGNSIYVETRGHNLLYDTGAKYRSGHAVFTSAVLPYLKATGVSHLDKLILSHDDNDHAGGLRDVEEQLSIDKIESGMAESFQSHVFNCESKDAWYWDDVSFRYIHPISRKQESDNDRSCMLLIRSKHCSLLVTGDASKEKEQQAMRNIKQPVEWLVAGHHGSRTSTSKELLDYINPKTVIFSTGFLNPYGHPHQEVLSLVEGRKSQIFRTDLQGAIHLYQTESGECKTESWRAKEKRYWTVP